MDQTAARWILLLAAVALSLMARTMPAQIALNDPSYAVARHSVPPAAWRVSPLDEDATIVAAWFGTSDAALPDRTTPRTIFTAWDPVQQHPMLELRYRPSDGAVLGGVRDSTGTWRPASVVSSAGPLADELHYLLAASFDFDGGTGGTGRMDITLLVQGSSAPVGSFAIDGIIGGLAGLPLDARLYLGDPRAAADTAFASHTDPLFAVMARRGTLTASEATQIWTAPDGPRFRSLLGTGMSIEGETIFAYGHSGNLSYETPGQTGTIHAWFDGDAEGWSRWLGSSAAVRVDADGTGALALAQAAPMHEPNQPWSGFWKFTPPDSLLALDPVPGTLPELYRVLTGTRIATAPIMAWGLGNSRWANTTAVPAAPGASVELSRSHLYGLRGSRPAYDGGLVVLDLSAERNIPDLTVLAPGNLDWPVEGNWSRFTYGGSQAALLGNGRPSHLVATPGASATTLLRVTRPAEATEALGLLLLRPNGGTVRTTLEVGNGAGGTTLVPGAPPLFGLSRDISTNTARNLAGVPVVAAGLNTITLPDSAAAVVGDAVVIGGTDAVSVIAEDLGAAGGERVFRLEHPWAFGEQPSPGATAFIGPWSFLLVGHAYDPADPAWPERGLRFEHVAGGRVTVLGAGYRERAANRLCYIWAGRGGEGQAEQRDREFAGTLRRMSDALGVGLYFAGNATQSTDTLPALQDQLGDLLGASEIIGTPDVVSGPGATFFVQDFLETHEENRAGALLYDRWAYLQIQDEFPGMFDQAMALWRQDPNHPNGRGMFAAGDQWWTAVEASLGTVVLPDPCPADTNGDGTLSPGDFTAWVAAYNAGLQAADQNADGLVSPGDFTAWVANYQAGCP